MLITLESSVRPCVHAFISILCILCPPNILTHTFCPSHLDFPYNYTWLCHLAVPMDLDVKMKAVMVGAVFLIVSYIL